MNAIASFMQNANAVIALGMFGMLLGFVGVYCQFHTNQYPTNLDQLTGVTQDYPGDPNPNIKWPGNIGFDAIEFVDSDLHNLRTDANPRELHNKIIIRERMPRKTPSGRAGNARP